MSDKNILLCDVGGTHARFARLETRGVYKDFKKYRLNDFQSFEDIVKKYHDDTGLQFSSARFSVARTPFNKRIEYQRHAGDPDYVIDFNIVEDQFGWCDAPYLNDLEAAAHGLRVIGDDQLQTVIPAQGEKWNDHKILISVGTGVGHAGIFNDFIMRTCGGHFLPITVTEEHRKIEKFIRNHKDPAQALIMEDFVSGRGLRSITEYISAFPNDDMTPDEFLNDLQNHPDALRLFFEFLGIYAHNIVCITGAYGGVYLTGGVIDHLMDRGLTDWAAFEKYFRHDMVDVVTKRLCQTPISVILENELPLLGLSAI
jgi:glucokinase